VNIEFNIYKCNKKKKYINHTFNKNFDLGGLAKKALPANKSPVI
jgi:hypothetical protein